MLSQVDAIEARFAAEPWVVELERERTALLQEKAYARFCAYFLKSSSCILVFSIK